MTNGNWEFLFLGKDELETTFSTASRKKSLMRETKKKSRRRKKCKFITISQAHEIRHQNEKRAVLPLQCAPIVCLKSGPQCLLLSGETFSQEPHHVVNSYINLSDSFKESSLNSDTNVGEKSLCKKHPVVKAAGTHSAVQSSLYSVSGRS